jgi:hypothetical protein
MKIEIKKLEKEINKVKKSRRHCKNKYNLLKNKKEKKE